MVMEKSPGKCDLVLDVGFCRDWGRGRTWDAEPHVLEAFKSVLNGVECWGRRAVDSPVDVLFHTAGERRGAHEEVNNNCAVIDLGSNWGFFSFYAASLGADVVGLDPQWDLVEAAMKTSELIKRKQAVRREARRAVVGDKSDQDSSPSSEVGAMKTVPPRLLMGSTKFLAGLATWNIAKAGKRSEELFGRAYTQGLGSQGILKMQNRLNEEDPGTSATRWYPPFVWVGDLIVELLKKQERVVRAAAGIDLKKGIAELVANTPHSAMSEWTRWRKESGREESGTTGSSPYRSPLIQLVKIDTDWNDGTLLEGFLRIMEGCQLRLENSELLGEEELPAPLLKLFASSLVQSFVLEGAGLTARQLLRLYAVTK